MKTTQQIIEEKRSEGWGSVRVVSPVERLRSMRITRSPGDIFPNGRGGMTLEITESGDEEHPHLCRARVGVIR
jgi:hypothetical protein